jgi:hypothetical protein
MRLHVYLAIASSLLSPLIGRAEGKPSVDFERDVLPLFKSRCFSCHDGRKQKAALRLDIRSRALKGGESGRAAIVPGKSSDSELIRRLVEKDAEKSMPPGGTPLPERDIATLRAWIDAGSPWPDALANENNAKHWAFVAPQRPPLPAVRDAKWVRTPIDDFILARLEREGLKPSPEADKVTLCRRLYLDLIGLPPSPKQVDEFVNDSAPNAYEKLVDKLLASSHYGERWSRLWLDAARYADSDGFEKDKPRFVWFYRDWVINAFNRDLPYDRFVIEQIAGDLLPNATQDQRVATGYLRNSMINEEGGIDPEQFRMEAMFDRMDAIGKGVLGLTIQCAQCHTHKFDPLTQTEYYRLFAYLNNAHEANVTVYTPEEQMRRADLFRRIREIEADLKHRTPDWAKHMAAWEKEQAGRKHSWTVVRPDSDDSGGQKHYVLGDGSVLAAGYAPTKHTTEFVIHVDASKPITAVRLEVLNDPSLPRGGPGRSIFGLFALSEFRVVAASADNSKAGKEVKIASATASVNPPEKPLDAAFDDKGDKKRVTGPIQYAIDGKDDTAWTTDIGPGRSNVPQEAVFVFEPPISFPKGAVLTFKLKQNHGGWNSDDNQNNNLGRFRFAVTSDAGAVADPIPARVREVLAVPSDKRSPAQVDAVFCYWRTTVAEWKDANDQIEALWKQHPEGGTQLTLTERDTGRTTHVLKRGDFLKPGDSVTPGVPAFLHPLAENAPANRLGLAMWLVDRKSPTTARAFVNRVWQAYFGAGLVSTSEDFGTQSEPPTHPELLDWLAVEFMDSGWSIKKFHKRIAMSATYRQSSRVSAESLAKDPYNRLLGRGPRFRVDAELVRDIALTSSGLLNDKIGGPSVFPPIPAFLMLPPASYGPKVWKEDTGPERYRRALYTFRFRSVPFPALQAFDAPNGDFACVKRPRSNTPLQALTALNETIFVECAQGFACRVLREGGKTDAERLEYAFRLCVSRKPLADEAAELKNLLAKERKRFQAPDTKPGELIGTAKLLPADVPAGESAAWVAVARVLLNLDETITKE